MPCPLCEVVSSVTRGSHPLAVAELPHTAVILGENQGCPGWCVAVLKHHVDHMAEMPVSLQAEVFAEVAAVAAAIRAEYGPLRINYECLGNQVAHVHWHVIPRHPDDPDPRNPVWGWSPQRLRGEMTDADRRKLASDIAARLA
ncbi:MAG: Protein hit [Phycisphaerales bacterium]|nr:Protein hit [Phycisphaerales bacterium]